MASGKKDEEEARVMDNEMIWNGGLYSSEDVTLGRVCKDHSKSIVYSQK